MKRAIVIRHVAFEDLGNLTEVLQQLDYRIEYIEASPGCLDELDPLAPELVIILGGPIGAGDDRDYPFIADELRWLEDRMNKDLPNLGICLGAQLIAKALGARVYPGPEKEIGWSPIELSDAGRQSPLKYLGAEYTSVLHWHGDTFDLPADTTLLASTDKYKNQAFTWGKNTMALQFHPEVTKEGLERWFIGHACEINLTTRASIAKLREDTAFHAKILAEQAPKFWQQWLENVENT